MPTLQWWTRDHDVNAADAVPYRLLEEVPELGAGDPDTGNMLIQGDNLEALKALLPFYAGQVKCIYIDPPYNTKSAFEHYDDNLEHSQWLAMIYPRLTLLRELLHDDGVLLISLNDDEVHYAKVICDEIFGRRSFVSSLVWNYEGNTDNQSKIINYHEYILVYSKAGDVPDPEVFDPNVDETSKLFRDEIRNTVVKNGPKNPPSTIVLPVGFPCSFDRGGLGKRGTEWPKIDGDVKAENYRLALPVEVTSGWSSKNILLAFISNEFEPVIDAKGQLTRFELTHTGAIEAVKVRQQSKGHFISVLRGLGTTNQMRLALNRIGVKFTFPKPVGLISYLVRAFSKDSDLVLDSFAGSGTTGHAVLEANTLDGGGRRFILVERSPETAQQITRKRLAAVCAGELNINAEIGESGFRFFRLGPPAFDENGQVRPDIDFATLAAHIWFSEARTPLERQAVNRTVLGVKGGRAIALLYNGVLRDRSVNGGNVLTRATLAIIRQDLPEGFSGELLVYGERCILSAATLERENITFRQTPYDVKARA